jgi:alkyl sulfatase BDS1-like metallo-beta-lactamase superfamily hydrolase
VARAPISPDVVRAMSLDLFFDYLGVRLDGEKAEGRTIVVNWVFTDLGRAYVLNLQNSTLTYLADRRSERADATVTIDRATLDRVVLREMPFADAVARGLVAVDDDAGKLRRAVRPARRLHPHVRGGGAEAGGMMARRDVELFDS